MTTAQDRRIRAWDALVEQRHWVEKCGRTLSGYIARYGRATDPDHLGDGAEAIYAADMGELRKREEVARQLGLLR